MDPQQQDPGQNNNNGLFFHLVALRMKEPGFFLFFFIWSPDGSVIKQLADGKCGWYLQRATKIRKAV